MQQRIRVQAIEIAESCANSQQLEDRRDLFDDHLFQENFIVNT